MRRARVGGVRAERSVEQEAALLGLQELQELPELPGFGSSRRARSDTWCKRSAGSLAERRSQEARAAPGGP